MDQMQCQALGDALVDRRSKSPIPMGSPPVDSAGYKATNDGSMRELSHEKCWKSSNTQPCNHVREQRRGQDRLGRVVRATTLKK